MADVTSITTDQIAECVQGFRLARPHVHCITNSVAQNFTANVLLAAGATPSMTIAEDEISDFVAMADALLINLGTMDSARTRSVGIAVDRANELGKPWALDPVFVQASSGRLHLARDLLEKSPGLIRCNGAEAKALFVEGFEGGDVHHLAQNVQTTIALTGKVDHVSDGHRQCRINNGSSLMDRVTAMGCALNALMAGFCAVEKDHCLAAASALVLFGLAGEMAEKQSNGPGTFVPQFIDALANLSEDQIASEAKLS